MEICICTKYIEGHPEGRPLSQYYEYLWEIDPWDDSMCSIISTIKIKV